MPTASAVFAWNGRPLAANALVTAARDDASQTPASRRSAPLHSWFSTCGASLVFDAANPVTAAAPSPITARPAITGVRRGADARVSSASSSSIDVKRSAGSAWIARITTRCTRSGTFESGGGFGLVRGSPLPKGLARYTAS